MALFLLELETILSRARRQVTKRELNSVLLKGNYADVRMSTDRRCSRINSSTAG